MFVTTGDIVHTSSWKSKKFCEWFLIFLIVILLIESDRQVKKTDAA